MEIATSLQSGWRSIYLRHAQHWGACDEIEPLVTPDQVLVVTLSGNYQFEALVSGRWRKALRRRGSVGMIPGGETIRLRWRALNPERSFENAHVYIPQTFFREAAEYYRQAGTPCPKTPLTSICFDDETVAQSVTALTIAMRMGAPDFYAETAAQWLAVHLLSQRSPWRELIDDARRPGALSDSALASVVEFMHIQFHAPLSLDQMAGVAGISKFHFARLFRRHLGETPLRYLTRLRLSNAQRLLTSTDMPIGAVAVECGYAQPAHFGVAFRTWFGCTPTQMRMRKH
jgi:AraC family transcriptional regulator